jgi:predicted acetyltransferase
VTEPIRLLKPSLDALPSYKAALQRGWSPDNIRGLATTRDQLTAIAADPAGFVASLDDPEARGAPIIQLDGTTFPRLPGYSRWIWDGEFCGSINFRWQAGTEALPPQVLGHIGYGVVPWKQGLGHASRALALLLPDARALGMAYVELTTEAANIPSQRVILANGGRLVERFNKLDAHGGAESLRYRIDL